ncbi:MAG: 4Fe-4S dicluster domain-containing protein, partial [Verrucomicrobiota bacterium]
DAPADLNFKEALIKAKQSIHVGERTNATAHACTYHLPASHYLESWSDTRTANGVYSIVQPMIYPLYEDCVSELELLSALLSDDGTLVAGEVADGSPSPAYTYLRETFAGLAGEGEEKWKKLLHDGYHAGSKYDAGSFSPDASALSAAIAAAPKGGGVELIFASDASVWDGRWIDNGWLQEAPDPQSKVTWDNVALVSPKTAKRLGIYDEIVKLEPIGTTMYGIEAKNAGVGPDKEGEHRTGALIKLTVGGKTVEVPAQIGFGQADDTIIVPLGYGQGFDQEDELGRTSPPASHVGQVGVNSGFDVYPLRDSKHSYFVALDEDPAKTGKRYSLACTQEHHSMYGRALAREVSTLENKKSHKDFQQQLASVKKQGMDSHMPPNVSLYKQEDRDGQPLISDKIHQWAMSIDLSACTGCNACLVACQAENNIPIVGKEQVAMGREMHWIRMDRYFAAQPVTDDKGKQKKEGDKYLYDEDNPSMVPQPVACVQCESAPCETVCPVNATVHTEDGLNAMAYNRCIGTRYCANNCPYKARRFNFFDYNKRNPLVAHNLYRGPLGEKQVGTAPHLQRNPNVSVRMRGVMEKCTYCVQRLKDATIRQKRRQKQEALANGDSAANTVTVNTLRIPVDSVKVACQDACSSGAIAFGNLLDEEKSRMVRAKGVGRNYDLLQYIGTIPRTSYLARVKNPNKDMPGAHSVGRSTINMH